MKYIKITVYYVLLPLLLIVIGASGASLYLIDFGKEAYKNDTWYNVEDGGIDESITIPLGGFDQFVRIRGRDLNNPVLLYLHGGPGYAMTNFTHRLFRPQTEYFTLVEWDQRGAGKSFADESINATMSYAQMVEDTIELIEYLQNRLKVEKVIVVGSSWGTMLGLGVINKRPDLVHAYVGSGQGLAWRASLNESQRLMIEAAEEAGNEETLAALKAIPQEWPPAEDWKANRDRVMAVQVHLQEFRASYFPFQDPFRPQGMFVLDTLFSPDSPFFSFLDMFRSREVSYDGVQALSQSLWDFNLLNNPDYYEFEVPIIIFQGDHDWQTPTTLVKEWFSKVKAPHKEYIAFEHSAHYVITEEPAKYIHSLISRVRPFAVGSAEP